MGQTHANQSNFCGSAANAQQQQSGQMVEGGGLLRLDQRQQQKQLFPNMNRRNIRTALELEQQRQMEQRRQSRSKSLEPKAAHEIRSIEHSKSARYGPRTGNSSRKSKEKELWNPEMAAAQLIGLQLQNPHAAQQNLLGLIGGQQTPQLVPRQFRKTSGQGQISMDLDLGVGERKDANATGLSSHQIAILQKIWERSPESEIADCARNIMSHLLRSNAQMYQFFDLLGYSDREILTSATFLRMSANFAIVLDFVLTNVQDEAQKVCMALQCLGAQHARLPWPIEFHHWALFTRCFEDNPPKEVFQNAEGHDLWKSMINFLVIQMRLGYDRATGVESSPLLTSGRSSPRLSIVPGKSPRQIRKGSARKCDGLAARANTMAADVE